MCVCSCGDLVRQDDEVLSLVVWHQWVPNGEFFTSRFCQLIDHSESVCGCVHVCLWLRGIQECSAVGMEGPTGIHRRYVVSSCQNSQVKLLRTYAWGSLQCSVKGVPVKRRG